MLFSVLSEKSFDNNQHKLGKVPSHYPSHKSFCISPRACSHCPLNLSASSLVNSAGISRTLGRPCVHIAGFLFRPSVFFSFPTSNAHLTSSLSQPSSSSTISQNVFSMSMTSPPLSLPLLNRYRAVPRNVSPSPTL
jgi:hypothetical protein